MPHLKLASALVARFQDRLGHKRTVSIFLLTWVAATAGLAGLIHLLAAGVSLRDDSVAILFTGARRG